MPDNSGNPAIQNEQTLIDQLAGLETYASQNSQYVLSMQTNFVFYYYSGPTCDSTNAQTCAAGVPATYTSYAPVAVQYLQDLARAGDGRLFNISSGQTPSYSSFIVPPLNEPLAYSDLYVRDLNTSWTAPAIQTASDGRMGDNLRESMGAPASVVSTGNADSDENGVSDLVEYLYNGKICNDPNCLVANATRYDHVGQPCNSFAIPATSRPVKYTQNLIPQSIFNDCELTLLNANFDHTGLIHGTTVPQDLAALMNYPISVQAASSWLWSSPFGDSYDAQQRIKVFVDPFVSTMQIYGYQPYNYQVNTTTTGANGQTCYQAVVSNITMSSLASDTIRAYLIQTGVNTSLPYVRVGQKTMTNSVATVQFNDSDLQ
jgi:hypothetical protein